MKKLMLLALAILVFACSNKRERKFSLIDHIPDDTEIFMVSNDLKSSITAIKNDKFINKSDFPLKSRFSRQLDFLENLNLKNPSGISFSGLSNETFIYTLVTKQDSALVQLDSVKNKSVETIRGGDNSFQKIEIDKKTFFLSEKGTNVFISNSRQKILNIVNDENLLKDESFKKAYHASDPNKLSVFIKHTALGEISEFFDKFHFPGFKEFADWSVIDLELNNSTININGLSLTNKPNALLKIFSDTNPKNIESGKICPEDFLSLSAVSYSSFEKLHSNLKAIHKDSSRTDYPKVLDHTREVSLIKLKEGNATVLNAIEIEAAREKLAGMGALIETYRGADIIELENSLNFQKTFSKLLEIEPAKFYTLLDHFLIFSADPDVLKKILTDFQNSDIIAEKSYYKDMMASLSSESSMLFLARFPQFLDDENSKLKFEKNSIAALQFVNEGDFAHIHGVFSNSEAAAQVSNGAEQIASFKLDNPLMTNPVFFKNHRTDQMDIAVQDETNSLYLISNKGNIFWKKQLDSQITSPIYQVDLFKNGNQQLAFSTGYNFEVLDRNGNKVEGFPIKFNNSLTQPLSVFDYDKNRNYRFVLTQDKKVYMVGPTGNAIKGFDFENASSDIIQAPKHIRLGTKDYIMVAEESGKLNILSRQGNIRVPVSENIDFSENEWFGHKGKFVSTAPQNELIEISQQGQVAKQNLELAENNRIVANDDHLVYLNENQLSIDGKTISLDFGLYTDPQLFQFRKRALIAITDTQTQKVYVFDENAQLLDGFPVYGNSKVDIANADLDSRLELVVKGEENEILLYKL